MRESLDASALRAARGGGAIDLALGETLLRLFDGDRLMQLGYARQADYVRERLGVSLRLALGWTQLARGLASRPVLRRAVVAGLVTPRKARVVMEAASGADEVRWTAAAAGMGLSELERCVRGEGLDAAESEFEVESVVLRMDEEQQVRLDAALALAKRVHGPASPRWQRLEAICQEWLGEFGGLDRFAEDAGWEPIDGRLIDGGLIDGGLASGGLASGALGFERALLARPPDDPGGVVPERSAEELDARARELVDLRLARDEKLGRALEAILRERAHRGWGYGTFDEYVRDRLGVAPRTARQRVWLERKMQSLPPLREALARGTVTLTKALMIADRATPADVEQRIAEAAATTAQQVQHEATAEEDRQNRARGVRRIWGPADAFETILFAIRAVQELHSRVGNVVPGAIPGRTPPSRGEALAIMADHFVAVWTVNLPPARVSRARATVLGRHGGRCAVPGCSAPAAHVHHIVYRSRGGSDEIENELALCAAHHLRGVHGGWLRVEGRAGDRLVWRFGEESWATHGDDDVRRLAAATKGGATGFT